MIVPIGKLNRRITIQQKTLSQDSMGQEQEVWSDLCRVWAAFESLSSKEAFLARQAGVIASLKVTINYREDVHRFGPLCRVATGLRQINIVSASEIGIMEQLELLCYEAEPWPNQV